MSRFYYQDDDDDDDDDNDDDDEYEVVVSSVEAMNRLHQKGFEIDSLEITDEFLRGISADDDDDYQLRQQQQQEQTTPKQLQQQLRQDFLDIGKVSTLKSLELKTDEIVVSGKILALALSSLLSTTTNTTSTLQTLRVYSGLSLETTADVQALATALSPSFQKSEEVDHHSNNNLRELSLKNLSIKEYNGLLGGLFKRQQTQQTQQSLWLDSLMTALSSKSSALHTMELTCIHQNTSEKPNLPTPSPKLSCASLTRFFLQQSTKPTTATTTATTTTTTTTTKTITFHLKRLNLSNLGLRDEHFITLAQHLSSSAVSSSSFPMLKELILNHNHHTDHGLDVMFRLVLDGTPTTKDPKDANAPPATDAAVTAAPASVQLTTFQAYQEHRTIGLETFELLQQILLRQHSAFHKEEAQPQPQPEQQRLQNVKIHAPNANRILGYDLQLHPKMAASTTNGDIQPTTTTVTQVSSTPSNTNAQQEKTVVHEKSKVSGNVFSTLLSRRVGSKKVPRKKEAAKPVTNTIAQTSVMKEHNKGGNGSSSFSANEKGQTRTSLADSESKDGEISKVHGDLKSQGLPTEVSFPTQLIEASYDQDSVLSLGDRSFVQDWYQQKQAREELIREEALAEAQDLFRVGVEKKAFPESDTKVFYSIFQAVLEETTQKAKARAKTKDLELARALKSEKEHREKEQQWKEEEKKRLIQADITLQEEKGKDMEAGIRKNEDQTENPSAARTDSNVRNTDPSQGKTEENTSSEVTLHKNNDDHKAEACEDNSSLILNDQNDQTNELDASSSPNEQQELLTIVTERMPKSNFEGSERSEDSKEDDKQLLGGRKEGFVDTEATQEADALVKSKKKLLGDSTSACSIPLEFSSDLHGSTPSDNRLKDVQHSFYSTPLGDCSDDEDHDEDDDNLGEELLHLVTSEGMLQKELSLLGGPPRNKIEDAIGLEKPHLSVDPTTGDMEAQRKSYMKHQLKLERIQKENEEIQFEHNSSSRGEDGMAKRIDELERELLDAQKEHKEVIFKFTEKEAEKECEVANLESQLQEKNRETEQNLETIRQLQSEIESLRKNHLILEEEKHRIEQDRIDLVEEKKELLASFQEENCKLESDLKIAQQHATDLESQNESLGYKVQQISEKCNSLELDLESKAQSNKLNQEKLLQTKKMMEQSEEAWSSERELFIQITDELERQLKESRKEQQRCKTSVTNTHAEKRVIELEELLEKEKVDAENAAQSAAFQIAELSHLIELVEQDRDCLSQTVTEMREFVGMVGYGREKTKEQHYEETEIVESRNAKRTNNGIVERLVFALLAELDRMRTNLRKTSRNMETDTALLRNVFEVMIQSSKEGKTHVNEYRKVMTEECQQTEELRSQEFQSILSVEVEQLQEKTKNIKATATEVPSSKMRENPMIGRDLAVPLMRQGNADHSRAGTSISFQKINSFNVDGSSPREDTKPTEQAIPLDGDKVKAKESISDTLAKVKARKAKRMNALAVLSSDNSRKKQSSF